MSLGPKFKIIKPKTNTIFRGDNLAIMRAMPDDFVDLCYIDPPFFTQRNYKNIWGDKESVLDWENSRLDGFFDTKDFFEKHIHTGETGLAAYLSWMRLRLKEIYRVLKSTGSIYVHIDYHASHYIRVIMDEIFGYKNFHSEIIWRRINSKGLAFKGFPNNSDTIFYYTKSNKFSWNRQFQEYEDEYVKQTYRHIDEKNGRYYSIGDLTNPNKDRPNLTYKWNGHIRVWRWTQDRMKKADAENLLHYSSTGIPYQKRFLDEMQGRPVDNIWNDILPLQPGSPERVGWPTQKPVALLERIIKASSNEGDLIFDCFAGCGTAMHAAHKLKRGWIGIDISTTAIKVNQKRLGEARAKVEVIDENELPVELGSIRSKVKLKKTA